MKVKLHKDIIAFLVMAVLLLVLFLFF